MTTPSEAMMSTVLQLERVSFFCASLCVRKVIPFNFSSSAGRVKMLTKSCIKSGSDIIAPACGLGMKSPLVNIQAILACMQEDEK